MKMTKSTLVAVMAAALLALTLAACGDDDGGGPMDGTYTLSTLACDGVDATMVPQMTLNVDNTSGSFVLGFGPDCVATIDETYSYSGDTISITPTVVTCNPSSGCSALFGSDCMPLPPPTDFAFDLSGDTLTFSKTSVGPPADSCPAGAAEVYTMAKQ